MWNANECTLSERSSLLCAPSLFRISKVREVSSCPVRSNQVKIWARKLASRSPREKRFAAEFGALLLQEKMFECWTVSSCWFNHLSFVPGKLAEQRWFNFATALLSRVSCISVKQQELLTKSCMLNKITFRQSASSAGDPYLGSGSSFHGVFFGQIIFKHSQIMLLGLIKKNIWSFPVWKIRNVIFEGFHLYKVDVLNSNLVGWLIRRKEKKKQEDHNPVDFSLMHCLANWCLGGQTALVSTFDMKQSTKSSGALYCS